MRTLDACVRLPVLTRTAFALMILMALSACSMPSGGPVGPSPSSTFCWGEITTQGSFDTFESPALGMPGTIQEYSVSGEELEGDITVTAPGDFQLSLDPARGWQQGIVLQRQMLEGELEASYVPDTRIFVRYFPQTSN